MTLMPLPKAAWVIPRVPLALEGGACWLLDTSSPRLVPASSEREPGWQHTPVSGPLSPRGLQRMLRLPPAPHPLYGGRVTFTKQQPATPPSPTSTHRRPSALGDKTSARGAPVVRNERTGGNLIPSCSQPYPRSPIACSQREPRQRVCLEHTIPWPLTLLSSRPKQRDSQLLPPAGAGTLRVQGAAIWTSRPSPIGPCRPLSSPGMATPADAALSLFLLDSLSRKLLPASQAEPRIPPQILRGAWPLRARSSHFQALLPGAAPRVQLQAGSRPAGGLTQVQPLVPHPRPAAPPPAPSLAATIPPRGGETPPPRDGPGLP